MNGNITFRSSETLNNESREVLVDRLMECLKNWEEKQLCVKSF